MPRFRPAGELQEHSHFTVDVFGRATLEASSLLSFLETKRPPGPIRVILRTTQRQVVMRSGGLSKLNVRILLVNLLHSSRSTFS
jgi:hypothetical protein